VVNHRILYGISSLMPTPAAPSTALARPVALGKWLWRLGLALVLLGGSILLLAWLILQWGILPRIDQWRPQIEAQATRALGVAVRIGNIEVGPGHWARVVTLRDVALMDARGNAALALPQISVAVSPTTLFPRGVRGFMPRFEQVLIEAPRLDVRRDAQGKLWVAGLDLSAGAPSDENPAADWLFSQREFVIRDGALTWTDEQRGAPPVALTAVSLVVRNWLGRHELRLDATPPPQWGERFSLRGQFRQPLLGNVAEGDVLARPGDWRRWRGDAYADLPSADVSAWRRHVDVPMDLRQGRGALRLWVTLERGTVQEVTTDLALREVDLQFANVPQSLVLQSLATRLTAERTDNARGTEFAVRAQALAFTTGDGVVWAPSDLQLTLQRERDGSIGSGKVQADRLDLGVLALLATRVPIAGPLRKFLDEAQPQGVVQPLRLTWQGPLAAPTAYTIGGRGTALTLAAGVPAAPSAAASHPVGRPGMRNAAVDFEASETGGRARLAIARGALEFPGVFEQPVIALDEFDAQVSWKLTPRASSQSPAEARAIEVQVRDAKFANADAQGQLNGAWRTGAGSGVARGGYLPGQIELDATLTRANAARAARYLPLGIAESARRYIERSVRAGRVSNASARVRGDLWDFPYARRQPGETRGEFKIRAAVQEATYAFIPDTPDAASPWPAFTNVRGELQFDGASMAFRNAEGRIGVAGAPTWDVRDVNGGIADFREGVLQLQGQGAGPLAGALKFMEASPIGRWTHHALARAQGDGSASLDLALTVPLHDAPRSTVRGTVALKGNDLRITPGTPALDDARGRVEFTERGFAVREGTATVLGGPARFEGGLQGDAPVRFAGSGTATAEALRAAREIGIASRFATQASGSAPYAMELSFPQGRAQLLVTSTLVGMASSMPAPLGKAAEQALPLRVELRAVPGAAARDQVRLDIGNVLQGQFTRDVSGEVSRLIQGGVGVGAPVPAPERGVTLAVNLGAASFDAWRTWLGGAGQAVVGDGHADEGAGAGLDTITLRTRELTAFDRKLTGVNATVTRKTGGADEPWRVQIEADQLAGRIDYLPALGGPAGHDGRVYARLARLALPPSDARAVETLLDQETTPPSLDIVVDDFELRGKKLGKLEIEASNRGEAAQREWRLAKLNLTMPQAQFTATGRWAAAAALADPAARLGPRRRTALDFTLTVSDGGALLDRLGFGQTVRGAKGQMAGSIGWYGSPLSVDYPSLSGNVKVALAEGQFLRAEPGAARLLGVLSLQALPRRLLLDFRDVFREGFGFDDFSGDVTIAQGMASTRNLRMRGVQAVVLMEGAADLARETQDLRVWVVPEINAGTASLAYAIINPAVGLSTFLGQLFLRKPLAEANTREFRVTGAWADPKVDRVEQRTPTPSLDAAAAAVADTGASAPAATSRAAPSEITP
jgi:uncharacterized protein (TIGR02099 family)